MPNICEVNNTVQSTTNTIKLSSLLNKRECFEIVLLLGASQTWCLIIQKRPLQSLISGDG